MTCIHSNCNCLNNKIAEISSLRMEVTNLQSQISVSNLQLADKQHQISATQNELEHTRQLITTLKLENNEKDIELKRKDDEIKVLKENLADSQKGFLSEKLKDEVRSLTYYDWGYFSPLSIEELVKFYENREKEIRDYKCDRVLHQNFPTREEKIWSLEEQLEILDNNLQTDESELVFLEWRLEKSIKSDDLIREVNEKRVERQQSIRKLKTKKEIKEQRIIELKAQIEVPPKK